MILNLTPYKASQEEINAGVVDSDEIFEIIDSHLSFNLLPIKRELETKALILALAARGLGYSKALIGGSGATYFFGTLETALRQHGITPMYSIYDPVTILFVGFVEV
jgi:hypothetical protein